MKILNDITNTFSFSGGRIYSPGKHQSNDFMSSIRFGEMASIANHISWSSGYNQLSSQGHISCFYGSIVFREVDGTMSALLDSTFSNYGIDLEVDSTDTTTPTIIFNNSYDRFEIPLLDDLVFDDVSPFVKVEILPGASNLYSFRGEYNSYSYKERKVYIKLRNIITGYDYSALSYSLLSDYQLRLFIFGMKTIDVEDL